MEPGEVHSFLQKADNVAAGAARVALWLSGAGLGPGLTASAAPLVEPPAIRRCLHAYTCRSVRLRLSRFSAPPSPFLSPASRLSITASRLLSLLLLPHRTEMPLLTALRLSPLLSDSSLIRSLLFFAPSCSSLPPVLRSLLFFALSCSSLPPVRSLVSCCALAYPLLFPIPGSQPLPLFSALHLSGLFSYSQPSISAAASRSQPSI